MSTDLPAPLVPPGVDLRDFQFMPLYGARLLDSETWLLCNAEEKVAALTLWWKSWHQVPAASIPDDDRLLAHLAGYGVAVEAWLIVKSMAMRGWVKCSDGRFYHPVVSEFAIDSWLGKLVQAWGKECDRLRKENKKRKEDGTPELVFPPRPTRNSIIVPTEAKPLSIGNHPVVPAELDCVSDGTPHYFPPESENGADGIPSEISRVKGQGRDRENKREDSLVAPQPDGRSNDRPPGPSSPGPRSKRHEHPAFAEFWSAYPGRGQATNPRKPAAEKFARAVAAGDDPAEIVRGAAGYAAYCRKSGKLGSETVKQAVTFLSQEVWRQYLAPPPTGGPDSSEERRKAWGHIPVLVAGTPEALAAYDAD